MDGAAHVVPFAERFREQLAKLTPPLTQAEFADRAGVDRSLISRLLHGDRPPSDEVLRRLAPALDMDVEDLVRGTSAESRLREGSEEALTVRHSVYMDVLRKKAELEGRERELQETLEREISRRTVAESAASQAHQERERMRRDLDGALGTIKTQEQNLRDLRGSEARYRRMFSDALSQLQGLNVQVNELRTLLNSTNDELAAARKSGRLGVILSGIAAVTGVATFAHFLGKDADRDQSEQKPKTKSKAAKQGRHKS